MSDERVELLTDLLWRYGYAHERTANSANTGKHRVYRIVSGETVGEFDAYDAMKFLRHTHNWGKL